MKRIEYVHSLSEEELREIQQAIRTHPKPRVRVRAIMIRLSNERHKASEIAKMLGRSRQTALNQIHRYEQEGILGLEDKPRSGARAKADENYITQWLPGYCPKLNLIERFWRHMKQVAFDSYYWGDSLSLEQAVHMFFKEHNENPESDFAIFFRR